MALNQIYKPISKEIDLVEEELINIAKELGVNLAKDVFEHFYKMKGKFLRPALLLLSYNAVNSNITVEHQRKLILLATSMELIHNASLIHDDIVDGDLERRGQKTLNKVFGNKIAVLAGDAIYTKVFLMLSQNFPNEFSQEIAKMAEKMCLSEICNARRGDKIPSKEEYLELISDKTAVFMSTCCGLGASFAGASKDDINSFKEYGINFGLAYQVVDDYLDKDPIGSKYTSLDDAVRYAGIAKNSIANLSNSIYKLKLNELMDYVISMAQKA